MKIPNTILLLALTLGFSLNLKGQCSPSPAVSALGIPGVFADPPALGLKNGAVGNSYTDRLTILVPNNADIDFGIPGIPPVPGLPVNFQLLRGVSGIPPGLSSTCDTTGCDWGPDQTGCISVSGIPTTPGDYTIVYDMVINVTVPALPAPLDIFEGPFDFPVLLGTSHPVTIASDVGIAEDMAQYGFSLEQNSPNPAIDKTTVGFEMKEAATVSFEIRSMQGKKVYSESILAKSGYNKMNLEVSNLASGMYFYCLSNGAKKVVKKLVVAH